MIDLNELRRREARKTLWAAIKLLWVLFIFTALGGVMMDVLGG